MKLSIAMATYNGEKNIREQLDSFLCQTRRPDELVVCDDGSSDGTVSIIEAFSKNAPFPVEIYRNESNLGYTQNFALAALRCSGDVIFFSDQDDVWLEKKIERVVAAFHSDSQKLLLIHDGKIVDGNLRWRGATKFSQAKAGWGSRMSLATGALSAMRRELKPIVFPIPAGIVGHDWWIYALARSLRVDGLIEEPLQLIRRHGENTSAWVGSSVDRINRLDVLASQMNTKPATSYLDRATYNNALTERLARLRQDPERFEIEVIDDMLEELKSEKSALDLRNALVNAGFIRQKAIALEMMVKGKYRHFNGVKSFLRDMVRRGSIRRSFVL